MFKGLGIALCAGDVQADLPLGNETKLIFVKHSQDVGWDWTPNLLVCSPARNHWTMEAAFCTEKAQNTVSVGGKDLNYVQQGW